MGFVVLNGSRADWVPEVNRIIAADEPNAKMLRRVVMQQQIGFCSTTDGARIAYATVGTGPPLVVVALCLCLANC
jgi:hypothetical protein